MNPHVPAMQLHQVSTYTLVLSGPTLRSSGNKEKSQTYSPTNIKEYIYKR